MSKYFECGVRYGKVMDDGSQKRITELYIVDAISFTEAETRIIEEMAAYGTDFDVVSEKITNLSFVVTSNDTTDDKWYKVKVNIVTVDEKSGKVKKLPAYLLIQAKDIDTAKKRLEKYMSGTMADWECEAVAETKIVDVYFHDIVHKNDTETSESMKASKRFVDSIPDGQKVTVSATGCAPVTIDKTHKDET